MNFTRSGGSFIAVCLIIILGLALIPVLGLGVAEAPTDGEDRTNASDAPSSVFDPAALAAAGDDVTLDESRIDDVEIDPALEAAVADRQRGMMTLDDDGSGTELQVMVRFDGADPATLRASDDAVGALQERASTSQAPLKRYAAARDGIEFERGFWIANAALVTVDTSEVALEELAAIGEVERLHANHEVQALGASAATPYAEGSAVPTSNPAPSLGSPLAPDEPTATTKDVTTTSSGYTYGLEQINAPDVWADFGTQGEGASVAVLDTGIDVDNHNDLSVVDDGWADFVDGDNETVRDDNHHGTHVSGTVAGSVADNGDHYGVAPAVDLYHGKVLNESGGGSFVGVARGMEWAINQDVDVISMSLGATGYSEIMIDPVRNAVAADVSVSASSGNAGPDTSGSPGNTYEALAVGAVDENDDVASFSSGETVSKDSWDEPPAEWPEKYIVPDVSAPGVNVYSAMPGGGFGNLDGTSMAAPHVSGVIALMQSATDRYLTPSEIEQALRETAWKPDGEQDSKDARYGDGIVDARAAVAAVVGNVSVSGTITDGVTDQPIENATVSATTTDGDPINETTTSVDGTYDLMVLPGTEYDLMVNADGWDANESSVTVQSDPVTENAPLRGDADATVTVTDAVTGDSITNATVNATPQNLSGTYDATEGTDVYAIEDLPGGETYDLHAAAKGYESNVTELGLVESGGTGRASVQLTPQTGVEGTVADEASGTGIPNAAVNVTAREGEFSEDVTTDDDGTYSILVPGTGDYTVEVAIDGYDPDTRTKNVAVDVGTAIANVTFDGDANLTVPVIDTHFESPIANATVIAESVEEGVARGPYIGEYIDGEFVFENVSSAADYDVRASAGGYESNQRAAVQISSGGDETLVDPIELRGNATVNVTVVDGKATTGDRIEAATVAVVREDRAEFDVGTTTDADGTLSQTVPGTGENYDLTVESPGYESGNATVQVASGESVHRNVTLVGNATVSGHISERGSDSGTLSTDEPVANATINATADGRVYSVRSNESGAYAAVVPDTGDEYDIDVSARAFETNSTKEPVTGDANLDISLDRTSHYLGLSTVDIPESVSEGNNVTITATVVNLGAENWTESVVGSDTWNQSVVHSTDGTPVTNQPVDLAAGNQTVVEFTHAAGDVENVLHAVESANESHEATVEVTKSSGGGGAVGGGAPVSPVSQPDLSISAVDLLTSAVAVGEPAVVEVTVQNAGAVSGSMTPELRVDGEVVDSSSVTVAAGSSETVTFERAFDTPGSYELSVDGHLAGTVEVTDESATDAATESVDETGPDDDESDVASSIPGFGAAVAVLALAIGLAIRARPALE